MDHVAVSRLSLLTAALEEITIPGVTHDPEDGPTMPGSAALELRELGMRPPDWRVDSTVQTNRITAF